MSVSVPNSFTANTKIQSAQVNANFTAVLALTPISALGDIVYASSTTAMSRLAGNTTTTRKFLSQTGDGVNSAAPAWNAIAYSDASSLLPQGSKDALNLGLSVSVAANALTVALKQSDGSTDPTTAPADVKIGFRNSTATSGSYSVRSATAAASLTVASGATLGTTNGGVHYLYVYAIDNSGTIELAISGMANFDEGKLWTTTALSGSSNSAATLYSTTSRASKAIRLIGRIRISEATAGTWASSPTEVSVVPFPYVIQPTQQRFTSGSGTYTTPTSPSVPLYIRIRVVGGGGGGGGLAAGASNGGTGGNSTFGTSLLTANGGGGGTSAGIGGTASSSSSVAAPAFGIAIEGGSGGMPGGSIANTCGGHGAASFFGGAGQGGYPGTVDATSAATNSGSGGGGAQNSGASGAGGGAAGAYIEAIVTSPAATYAYAVGAAGAAGSGTRPGGAGGAGIIIVDEFYQ